MDNSITETVEKLFEKVENYSKTTIQLGKHLAIYSSAEIISNVAVKIVVFSLLGVGILFANIGLAIYLGEILQKPFLGFLIVAAFYLFVAILMFVFKNIFIKNPVSNYIVSSANKEFLS